jgi:peptidoglycan/xylan/chitin deacetylase (PgdA/CDA1 family)
MMPQLISDLKARGYRFVTLSEYMNLVGSGDHAGHGAAK